MTASPATNSRAVLVACMPKSGSTFLSALIASVPGFRREHIVPSYQRREQELSEPEILRAFASTQTLRRAFDQGQLSVAQRPRGFVCQNHVRHNCETQNLIERYGIVPIVLVRNIFDVVVSLRDHVVKESVFTPTAYVEEAMRDWEPQRMYAFLTDMAVPWYIHFYVSWMKSHHRHIVTYEELISDPRKILKEVLAFGKLPRSPEVVEAAMDTVQGVSTRSNVGTVGRGSALDEELKARIRRFCSYYPDVDFARIGVH